VSKKFLSFLFFLVKNNGKSLPKKSPNMENLPGWVLLLGGEKTFSSKKKLSVSWVDKNFLLI
jgi:hypothetical protein